jgi:hypothetical protein
MGIPVLPAIFKGKIILMKDQPFKRLNFIINAAKVLALNSGMSMERDLLAQDNYFSRGKGMNSPPKRKIHKHMAIKRASIKAKEIKKHGR